MLSSKMYVPLSNKRKMFGLPRRSPFNSSVHEGFENLREECERIVLLTCLHSALRVSKRVCAEVTI
jgi:hypothetical protein